MYYTQLCFSK